MQETPDHDAVWARYSAHFQVFRDYVEHEDELINERSTWHHTIQGLLFTALGITLQWKPDPAASSRSDAMQRMLMWLLPLLGILISAAAIMSIEAASKALDALRNRWHELAQEYPGEVRRLLPGLSGAGNKSSLAFGKTPAYAIPAAIGLAWALLLCVGRGWLR